MLAAGLLLAGLPVLWIVWRYRSAEPAGRMQALALITLFLTFDLVLFGAFTRLTDSGLGCPDWPGCYGSATPWGAVGEIAKAQAALPTGPVTHGKAWVEMVHRYLATGVGGLIVMMVVYAWYCRRKQYGAMLNPWWPTATLIWVCLQGAFGALTVTMKLFPAIVTMHLLGGYVLLALLAIQAALLKPLAFKALIWTKPLSPSMRYALVGTLVVVFIQAASGGWVSTNYAVLACNEFPKCQGSWWPPMDFSHAFELWRPLGLRQGGEAISFQALTAIHFVHRLLAVVTVLVVAALAWSLRSRALAVVLALQVLTGLSNVVFDWPLATAVMHTGGGGALVVILVWMRVTARPKSKILYPN
jgi:cytochrome c oxidase assembly protein subunit 15